jgi:6-phosphogluconolactonase
MGWARRILSLALATACGGTGSGDDAGTTGSSGTQASTTASTTSSTTGSTSGSATATGDATTGGTASGSTLDGSTGSGSDGSAGTTGGESTGASDTTGGVGGTPMVYVGSNDGFIHVFEMDLVDGSLIAVGAPVNAGPNSSFLAVDPQHAFLFAVNEVQAGAIASFAIDPADGTLTWIDTQATGAAGPAFVTTDHTGSFVLTAHYGGGSVAVLPVEVDGSLAPAVDVASFGAQALSHAIRTDPTNTWAFVPNKGLDSVAQFAFDATSGELTANAPASVATADGAGPRHLDFHPTQDRVYLIDELDDTLGVYALDPATGLLTELQVVDTLPMGVDGSDNACADVHVHPSGAWVYGSNRGHDSIAIFAIDGADGTVTPIGHEPTGGSTPRNFTIDPDGALMLVGNQQSDEVVAFAIDPLTGELSLTGAQTAVPSPAFVGIVRLGP